MSFKTKLLRALILTIILPVTILTFLLVIYLDNRQKEETTKKFNTVFAAVDEKTVERLTSVENVVRYAHDDPHLQELFSKSDTYSPYKLSLEMRYTFDAFNNLAKQYLDTTQSVEFYTDIDELKVRGNIHDLKNFPYSTKDIWKFGYDKKEKSIYYNLQIPPGPDYTYATIYLVAENVFSDYLLQNKDYWYEIRYNDELFLSNLPKEKHLDQIKNKRTKKIGKKIFTLTLIPKHRSFSYPLLLIILASVLFVFILSFIVYRQYHQILKIIGDLQKKVKGVLSNDESVDFTSKYNDELGRLSNNIQEMVTYLKNANEALLDAQVEIEKSNYRALVNQFDSHFLYNTLSFLNWRFYERGDTEMVEMVKKLSNYYRMSLNNGQNIVTLEKELMNIKNYLEIRQTINPGFYEVDYHIDEKTTSIEVIHLILQPIVENAIEHAFPDEESDNTIQITSRLEENTLVIVVEDNGIGMDQEELEKVQAGKTGYGLRNTRKRIKFYFGSKASFLISSKKNQGTKITLHLPIKELKQK